MLQIPENVSRPFKIEELMSHTFAPHIVPDRTCASCHLPDVAFKSYTLKQLKKILILRLEIFQQEVINRVTVRNYKVKFKINALPTTVLHVNGSDYTLTAAIFHEGTTPNAGHYYDYIRLKKEWFKVDDKKVKKKKYMAQRKPKHLHFVL